jgi:hypothetical protein
MTNGEIVMAHGETHQHGEEEHINIQLSLFDPELNSAIGISHSYELQV